MRAFAGWQTLPLAVAAQDVQHSGDPGAYATWESLADALVSTFSGAATACLTGNGGHVPASGTTQPPSDSLSRQAHRPPSGPRSRTRPPSSASPTSGAAPGRLGTTAPAW